MSCILKMLGKFNRHQEKIIIITAGTKTEVSGRKLFRNLRILQLAS